MFNGEGVVVGVNKGESGSLDCGIPLEGSEFVGVNFTIGVNQSKFVTFCCLNSNFVEFNFNFGLRQIKSG